MKITVRARYLNSTTCVYVYSRMQTYEHTNPNNNQNQTISLITERAKADSLILLKPIGIQSFKLIFYTA